MSYWWRTLCSARVSSSRGRKQRSFSSTSYRSTDSWISCADRNRTEDEGRDCSFGWYYWCILSTNIWYSALKLLPPDVHPELSDQVTISSRPFYHLQIHTSTSLLYTLVSNVFIQLYTTKAWKFTCRDSMLKIVRNFEINKNKLENNFLQRWCLLTLVLIFPTRCRPIPRMICRRDR